LATVAVAVAMTALVGLTGCGPSQGAAGSRVAHYVDISQVGVAPRPPAAQPDGSTGTWREDCGRNEKGIYNSDNLVVSPGKIGAAEHAHDYVGNVSTNAFSTDQSLAVAATTCTDGDRSSYYWPVLRVPANSDGVHEADGNHGRILVPASVLLEFRGSPVSKVVAMPRFLRTSTGNPHGYTKGGEGTDRLQWTCSGARDRLTKDYPRCAPGDQVIRIFDMPNCWNGKTTDSPDHRSHLVFGDSSGGCPIATFPVPQLHLEIAYDIPPGADYIVDTFPEEQHSALADHGHFINVMSEALMTKVVGCINTGRHCDE
jgi:hypothetical protein